MRLVLIAVSLVLAGCSNPARTPVAGDPRENAMAKPADATDDMAAMDPNMAAADAADDAATTLTPDDHTFHTYPAKIEIVRLPMTRGGVWSANGYAASDLFAVLDSKDEILTDGSPAHAVRFEMKASGNGKVVFERRETANPDEGVLEVRTVNFMIH
ncbi:MAG: hypothetical protein SGJ21_05390 [Alphaproteobacteria bacterium]|nr:hypothetical protein [Alphaproteobacteria bacterium]